MRAILAGAVFMLAAGAASAQMAPAPSPSPAPAAAPAAPRDPGLPAHEESARAVLEKSPRHGEYVDVKVPSGGAPVRTWVRPAGTTW